MTNIIERASRKEEMFALIEQWKQSSQTQKIFCQQQGIALSSFYYWYKKYREDKNGVGGFVSVIVKRRSADTSAAIEINYPNGVTVKIPAGLGMGLVKSLITLL